MKNKAVSNLSIGSFLINNWFKIAVICACAYIIFQKDMSFTLNFNAPLQPARENPEKPSGLEKESYTVETQQLASSSRNLEKLTIPFFGKKEKKKNHLQILNEVDEATQRSYLKRFTQVAISEQKKYGIPPSITLANALLHSYAGQSAAAQDLNNHFNIRNSSKAFERYPNAWSSFRDHSKYITSGNFIELRKLSKTDYRSWATALQDSKFNNEPELTSQLLHLIDKYNLHELD